MSKSNLKLMFSWPRDWHHRLFMVYFYFWAADFISFFGLPLILSFCGPWAIEKASHPTWRKIIEICSVISFYSYPFIYRSSLKIKDNKKGIKAKFIYFAPYINICILIVAGSFVCVFRFKEFTYESFIGQGFWTLIIEIIKFIYYGILSIASGAVMLIGLIGIILGVIK